MILSYTLRASILGFGCFFLLHALLGMAVSAAVNLRVLERIRPLSAKNLLMAFRLLPSICAAVFSCGVVIPAYFRWERQLGSETVGIFILLAAVAGVAIWLQSLSRSARALQMSLQMREQILETGEPFLAVAGIMRPRIIVTRGFLESIPSGQRAVALRHEMAHFRAADNLQRLLMLLAPPVLPGFDAGFTRLEQAWARYAERAADDVAVKGSPERATLLAEVLVRVARSRGPRPHLLVSTLVESQSDLSRRVQRLVSNSADEATAFDRRAVPCTAALIGAPLLVCSYLALGGTSKAAFDLIERLLLHA